MLVNGAGFYMYYALQLSSIKREMRAALKQAPDHQLQVLKLTRSQYTNSRQDEHEIRFNGKMYDVARIKTKGDLLWVYCIHDAKEDNLLTFIQEIIAKPLTNADSVPHVIIQYLTLTYINVENHLKLIRPERVIVVQSSYFFSVKTFCAVTATPPPWSFPLLI
jgi:hypothetical protein